MFSLSIVTLGDVHSEHLVPLSERFDRLEQLVLDINPRDPLAQHRAEFNRAVDAASHDWILIVRERERIDDALATAIATAVKDGKAWGFRVRVVPHYAGRPLLIGGTEGEVRLFHKRHYMRYANKGEWEDVSVQGTIVRLPPVFRAVTFESPGEHRRYREKSSARHSRMRQVFVFLRNAIGTATLDRNTLRYLWIEAGFD